MPIAAKLDEMGRGAWIALTILGFLVWWPLGLFVLMYSMWSGRMMCGRGSDRWEQKMMRLQEKMDRLRARMEGRGGWTGSSSGNRAFDEYREETLRRLEEEQREFKVFLDKLRFAKDKAEFDQFMAERRQRPQPDAPAA
ncbi:DUF2852 domain-containing protein [Chelatococcus composti]|jgi:hypothetical protein|uniref:DUF2852 domain-containing protein n=1 Tax=Chelatococcus composti TaxID=1743235 RepID=A0A841KD79_9HYPH|nr:DUF2852 domain-containing protein [Chelatococcus composti]MBB6167926.1 hypothetical protein [Chelatococcus composti]MBS7734879.1 DUF2852 domain-containing protein [Chelatococcus composti]PZN42601.1 MAG: hypothetical protein DIU59_07300 [Pseudomonadota bacterium]GGG34874.1 hypothetical protein GCM10008026_14540 [Chelatococcus composti]